MTLCYISRFTATTVAEPIKSQYSFKLYYCNVRRVNNVLQVKLNMAEWRDVKIAGNTVLDFFVVIVFKLNRD